MTPDIQERVRKFYQATNPSKTLLVDSSEEDRQYYINFASVRGGPVIGNLKNRILLLSPDEPTYQLFTGHVGCGKSTELRWLKAELEDAGFHVVYFESTQSLEMQDVDISDILLAITGQVSKNLEDIGIDLKPGYFEQRFKDIKEIFKTPIELSQVKLSVGIANITAQTKESLTLRDRLRGYLEPQTRGIIKAINQEVLEPAIATLKSRGKKGLVIIVDGLDKVANKLIQANRNQQEYLFVDRGDQLSYFNCHLIYTIPLALRFSNEVHRLIDRFGNIEVLPMVAVKSHQGIDHEEGINLLRQLVLARAFPELKPQERFNRLGEVFDTPEILERLCHISGGHVRQLLRLLNQAIATEMNLPISLPSVEKVIREEQNFLTLPLARNQWDLLQEVKQTQSVQRATHDSDYSYDILMRSLLVFEYKDRENTWFDVNPIVATDKELTDASNK